MDNVTTTAQQKSTKVINWLLLVCCALIWGFSYFFIKHALIGFDPIQVADLRMLSGGFALLPFVFLAFKKIPFDKYLFVFICAIIGSGIPIYLYPLAETHIDSSLVGIINSLTPLCTYIIGVLFFKLPNKKLKLIGVLIGLLGAVSLFVFKPTTELKANFIYLIIALSVPCMYGLSSNVLKKHLAGIPSLLLTALMYFMLLIPSIPLFFITSIPQQITTHPEARTALPYALMLGVFGTALAMTLFNMLIQRVNIMFAASVTYLMPIVAMVIGLLEKENIGWHEFLGLGLILGGVILINRVKE
jgi:drug/metabolite transporter (DMT)-like permease